MRFIICFTILFALTNGQKHLFSQEEGFKKVHKECQSDTATHVDEEVLTKFRSGEEVEDKNLELHIFCMNTKLNIQGKDGEINKDQIKRDLQYVFHPYVINDMVEECGTSEGESKYVVGKNLYKCLHKYADHVHNRQHHEKREHEYKTAYKECHYNELDYEEQRKFLSNENFDSFKLRKFVYCCAKKT